MNRTKKQLSSAAITLLLMGTWGTASAVPYIQCPGDDYMTVDVGGVPTVVPGHDGVRDPTAPDGTPNPNYDPAADIKCMHLSAGDGFSTMADGYLQYMFSFADLTGTPEPDSIDNGTLAHQIPAPTIVIEQGQEFYLTLTNVGMVQRPDLADPHTVHYHGFPNASTIFDGVPETTISIQMGASLTYYYNVAEPGTFMYHCHVEATEHMQMGMLGNLYVHSAQDQALDGTIFGTHTHRAGIDRYVYNDGDAATRYDVEYPIQMGSFDPDFHDASMNTQPLPFANMKDTYAMLNGRGYPDTINPDPLVPPAETRGKVSQPVSSLITATVGQKVLLRISNLNITNFYTLRALGLPPMRVVGKGAAQLKGPESAPGLNDGADLSYETNSITIGGGESKDVIIDTTGVAPGTYYLYTTNLNYLSNNNEDFGGMMTQLVIN